MARLPLGHLEDALRNPAAYRLRMREGSESRFGETYVGALRQTIFRYHASGNADEAYTYLEQRLANSARLQSGRRANETLENLDWYVEEHRSRGWPTFQAGVRLVVPYPGRLAPDIVCSGEIGRLDLKPTGGYAGWVISGDTGPGWEDQLRFPLMQDALAQVVLGVPDQEVSVGVCDFTRRQALLTSFSGKEIVRARRRFGELLRQLAR
jgi:hypothetical protein